MPDHDYWVGFDLDNTLAEMDYWRGHTHIGKPIPRMISKVKRLIEKDIEVKIVTARVGPGSYETREMYAEAVTAIQDWLEQQGIPRLEVVCYKDMRMACLYDDRAVQVERNTGRVLGSDPFPHA